MVVGAVVKLAEAAMVKGVRGADLVTEMEVTERLWLGGVEVEFGSFEWGKFFDREVFWQTFDGEAGKITGHLMRSLGIPWGVFICTWRIAD